MPSGLKWLSGLIFTPAGSSVTSAFGVVKNLIAAKMFLDCCLKGAVLAKWFKGLWRRNDDSGLHRETIVPDCLNILRLPWVPRVCLRVSFLHNTCLLFQKHERLLISNHFRLRCALLFGWRMQNRWNETSSLVLEAGDLSVERATEQQFNLFWRKWGCRYVGCRSNHTVPVSHFNSASLLGFEFFSIGHR